MKEIYWQLIAPKVEERAILRFLRQVGASPSWKILDVGCGFGRNLRFLRQAGYQPIGIELSRYAADKVRAEGFICYHLNDSEFKTSLYDVILMSHFIEHFSPIDLINVIDNYLDYLKLNGFLIIASPLPTKSFWDNFDHIKPYNPSAIEEVFGMRNHQVQYQSRNELKLIDLWIRRRPFKLSSISPRFSAPFLKREMTFNKILIGSCNIFMRILYSISFSIIGKADGWAGLYQKIGQ